VLINGALRPKETTADTAVNMNQALAPQCHFPENNHDSAPFGLEWRLRSGNVPTWPD
jgi:hypothetical protein